MSWGHENDCVGCETCIGCGRGEYQFTTCDKCGVVGNQYNPLFYKGNKMICADCLFEELADGGEIIAIPFAGYKFKGNIYESEEGLVDAFSEEYEQVEIERD